MIVLIITITKSYLFNTAFNSIIIIMEKIKRKLIKFLLQQVWSNAQTNILRVCTWNVLPPFVLQLLDSQVAIISTSAT